MIIYCIVSLSEWSYTLDCESVCRQKARTLNPSNRMRLASVTKSQLSCLRSALDAGGLLVWLWVFVLVVVVVIGWGQEGWGYALLKACVILGGNLCSQQQVFWGFFVLVWVFFKTSISSWYCERLSGVSENRCVCVCWVLEKNSHFRQRVKCPVIHVITHKNTFLGNTFLTSQRCKKKTKNKHNRSQLDQCFLHCWGTDLIVWHFTTINAWKAPSQIHLVSRQRRLSDGLAPITQWTAAASCLHGRV